MRPLLVALLAASAVALGAPVRAQPAPDSVAPAAGPVVVPVLPDSLGPSPRGAVTRALIAPGWGQVYNGQWLKAPLALAGVAGAVGYFVFNQRRYVLYRRATVFAGCRDAPGDPESSPDRAELCAEVAPAYEDEWRTLGERSFSTLGPIRDRARGQRDIAVVVVGVAYAFQALDAYIAAELADFDVSEDVVVRLAPTPDGGLLALRARL